MNRTFCIVGEAWERPFAWLTYFALRTKLTHDSLVLLPAHFSPAPMHDVASHNIAFVPCGMGFVDRETARAQLLLRAGGDNISPIEVRAGALPVNEHLDQFSEPLHRPPAHPVHHCEKHGRLSVYEVDTGVGYFSAIGRVENHGPTWAQYGPAASVFAYNTSDFMEDPPPPCDTYVILGSGLLGLRLVIDSLPKSGARIIVYDINPKQLEWTRFALANAYRVADLETLIHEFVTSAPQVSVRSVHPHEQANANMQAEWFRTHRAAIVGLRNLRIDYVVADIMTAPETLLAAIPVGRRTFLMYLDLFTIWHVNDPRPWVASMTGLSKSFESYIRDHVKAEVHFTPSARSRRFQLHPDSPFLRA